MTEAADTPESPETGPGSPRTDAWWEVAIDVRPAAVGAYGNAGATLTMSLPHRHAIEALNNVVNRVNPPWRKVRFVSPERELLRIIFAAHTVDIEPAPHPALLLDGAYLPIPDHLVDLVRQLAQEATSQ